MLGVTQRPFIFAQPRETRAGRGGFEGETLAQASGEGWLGAARAGAQNLVEQREPCASEKLRVTRAAKRVVLPPVLRTGVAFRPTRQRLYLRTISVVVRGLAAGPPAPFDRPARRRLRSKIRVRIALQHRGIVTLERLRRQVAAALYP
jgi:hypothetical protein